MRHALSSTDRAWNGLSADSVDVIVAVTEDSVPPPKLTSATFKDTGEGLTVLFDRDTNRAGLGGFWACSRLFSGATVAGAALGKDAKCTWSADDAVEVTFGTSPALLPWSVGANVTAGTGVFLLGTACEDAVAGGVACLQVRNGS